jgi:hypothetical protein
VRARVPACRQAHESSSVRKALHIDTLHNLSSKELDQTLRATAVLF